MIEELGDELFAWVTEVEGKRSLVGAIHNGLHMPLIASSRAGADQLEPLAVSHAKAMGQRVRLVRFKAAEGGPLREFIPGFAR